jgi:hypothetical protein
MISEHKMTVKVEYNSAGTAHVLGTKFRIKPAISMYYIGKAPIYNSSTKIWVYHFYDFAEEGFWRIKCKYCSMWYEWHWPSKSAICNNCRNEFQGIYNAEYMWYGINEKRGIKTIDRRNNNA